MVGNAEEYDLVPNGSSKLNPIIGHQTYLLFTHRKYSMYFISLFFLIGLYFYQINIFYHSYHVHHEILGSV